MEGKRTPLFWQELADLINTIVDLRMKRRNTRFFWGVVPLLLGGILGIYWVSGAFLNAATFALVVEMGTGLLAISAAWLIQEKLGVRLPKIFQAVAIWVFAYFVLRVILRPPIPFSLLAIYMGVVVVGTFLYVSITEEDWREFVQPIRMMMEEDTRRWRTVRYAVFAALPLIVSYGVFQGIAPNYREPVELIDNHPAPPRVITVHGRTFDLQTARNPFRVTDDPKEIESESKEREGK
jgi:hypothetical protein